MQRWRSKPSWFRAVFSYSAGFIAVWLLVNLGLYHFASSGARPSPFGTLRQKMSHFAQNSADYNLVFVGDSRTYCAMHPDLIDRRLGTRSINLSRWANWFPTQYAQFHDLIPLLAPNTVVLWSVGSQNFQPINAQIHTAYPLRLRHVPAYVRFGHPIGRMRDNLLFHNPLTTFIGWVPQIRTTLDAKLDRVVFADRSNPSALQGDEILEALWSRNAARPETGRIEFRREANAVTSIEIEKNNGAYERIEIDQGFFREKQREYSRELSAQPPLFEPDPTYWKTFVAMLELFAKHRVQLIVSEIEEAPHAYANAESLSHQRAFMLEQVAPTVRQHGFPYVRVNFDSLDDTHYFDYNHLNQSGITAFTAMLTRELAPHFPQ